MIKKQLHGNDDALGGKKHKRQAGAIYLVLIMYQALF